MKKLWIAFAAVLLISFSVLSWIGTRVYQEAPPLPDRVVTTFGLSRLSPQFARAVGDLIVRRRRAGGVFLGDRG